MNKEILQQANELYRKIEQTQTHLNQIASVLDDEKEDKVKTRIRGMDFDLPKAAFRSEVNKRKGELEAQLTALETEFSSL